MDALEAHLAKKAKARRTRSSFRRAKAKAYRIAKICNDSPDFICHYDREEESRLVATMDDVFYLRSRYVVHHYRNRCRCSCPMCGNPRRHEKAKWALTVAERRSHRDLVEGYAEFIEQGTD